MYRFAPCTVLLASIWLTAALERVRAAETKEPVHITVVVPPGASVWFDGVKTTQTGTIRHFASPSLASGYHYAYQVRAEWNQDGQAMQKTERVSVQPGERTVIHFDSTDGPRVSRIHEKTFRALVYPVPNLNEWRPNMNSPFRREGQ